MSPFTLSVALGTHARFVTFISLQDGTRVREDARCRYKQKNSPVQRIEGNVFGWIADALVKEAQ